VFASDVKDRWASDWVTWRGYGPFFSSVVRALQRQRPAAMALRIDPGVVRGTTRAMTLSIEARDAEGRPRDFLTPRLQVQSGSKPPVEIAARQTAPGHYETRIIVDAANQLAASVAGEGPLASALIVPDVNAEYRFRPADEPGLRSIADATGGRWMPTAESVATTEGERRATRRPLWPMLLWASLAMWMVDLLLRRVRVFEGIST
jgi:hypothetical protein